MFAKEVFVISNGLGFLFIIIGIVGFIYNTTLLILYSKNIVSKIKYKERIRNVFAFLYFILVGYLTVRVSIMLSGLIGLIPLIIMLTKPKED